MLFRSTRAVLIGARGTRVAFTKADMGEIYAPKASLPLSRFDKANLEEANLVAADLGGSNFTEANLTRANLQEAILRDAVLVKADLSGARLDAADIRGADLRGAILTSAVGLTQSQLDTACVDEQTKLPAELARPAPCSLTKKRAKP